MLVKEEVKEGIVNLLKANLTNFAKIDFSIRAMVDEKAIPTAGEEFIGVSCSLVNHREDPSASVKDIEYEIVINYTRRVNGIANEQVGEAVQTYKRISRLKPSIERRCGEIAQLLDLNWTLINDINSRIDTTVGCFATPFAFISMDEEPSLKEAEHFDIETDKEDASNLRYYALLTRIYFGGARYFANR